MMPQRPSNSPSVKVIPTVDATTSQQAYIAAITSTITIGSMVTILPLHNPHSRRQVDRDAGLAQWRAGPNHRRCRLAQG